MCRVEGCTHWMEVCGMEKVCEMEEVCVGWRSWGPVEGEWRWWWVRDTCGGGVHGMFGDGECMKLYRGVGWRCMGSVRLRCVGGAVQ